MRIRIALLLCTLAACNKHRDNTGGVVAQVTGDNGAVIGDNFHSVCSLYVPLPPDMGTAQDPIWCTGTLIADDMLITAASCVEENLTADTLGDIEVLCGANVDEPFGVSQVVLHRYYQRSTGSIDDLALVRLDGTPTTATVAVLNEAPLTGLGPSDPADCTDLSVSGCVALVGFGETANGADDPGSRNGTYVPLRSLDDKTLLAGTPTQTTCAGDTGAAVFMDLGDGPVLVAVSSSNRSSCNNNVVRTRVDAYLTGFIYPYL
ncbi:MAG TPA: trypsin-like serine protease, partial [Kofleriaceae bacterium]|nr:trypsin-like serine protease [Kofleriaceae bacterium]